MTSRLIQAARADPCSLIDSTAIYRLLGGGGTWLMRITCVQTTTTLRRKGRRRRTRARGGLVAHRPRTRDAG
jgi:hypothetical protein